VELFSAFLDTLLRTLGGEPDKVGDKELYGALGFALRLRVAVPDYEVAGHFWRRNHYEGSALLDRDLVFLAFEDSGLPGGWVLRGDAMPPTQQTASWRLSRKRRGRSR
jgi:hypothetical protein